MYSDFVELLNSTDNLYLTPPQQKAVLDYAKSLPERFDAVREVEANELSIVDAALESFQQAQPTVGDLGDAGWPSVGDDLRLALRLITLGHLISDRRYAEEKLLRNLRSQLEFLDLPSDAGRDLFQALADAITPNISPRSAAMLAPAFAAAVESFDTAA